MQIIRKQSEIKLEYHRLGYLKGPFRHLHKHRFRVAYNPTFFHLGFVCRDCDEIVVIERDIWNEMIRVGQDWKSLWRAT